MPSPPKLQHIYSKGLNINYNVDTSTINCENDTALTMVLKKGNTVTKINHTLQATNSVHSTEKHEYYPGNDGYRKEKYSINQRN